MGEPSEARGDYASRRLSQRPRDESLSYLRRVPVAFVSDCLKRLEVRNTQIHGVNCLNGIAERDEGQFSAVGPAVTMQFAPHSEVSPYYEAPYKHTIIVEEAQAGDVIVIAGHGAPYGFWGEHTTHQALNQGVSAVVIDGFTRDIHAIRKTAFPVLATGITFESYVRRYDPVGYNTPVTVGRAQVRPGDVIAADDDGALVIPYEVLESVVRVVREVGELEKELQQAVHEGMPWEQIYRTIHWKKYYDPARGHPGERAANR